MTDILNSQNLKNIAKALLLLQICLITWLCSGTRVEHLMPMFYVSSILFALSTISDPDFGRNIFQKTLFFSIIIFSIIATIQYANPFAEHIYEEKYNYIKNLEHISWLPTSVIGEFSDGNPMRSICVLLTSFLTVISAISLFRERRFARLALIAFALNSTLMAIFAIYQDAAGFSAPYNSVYSTSLFYGTFFLSNAAGAFLNMGMSACFALSIIFAKKNTFNGRILSLLWFLCAITNAISVYISESNAAIILCIFLAGCFLLYIFWEIMSRAVSAKTAAVILIFLSAIPSIIAIDYVVEANINTRRGREIKNSTLGRLVFYEASMKIISENPLWGIGGECSRYVLPNKLSDIKNKNNGLPSFPDRPHSDIIEYAVDYGIFGISLLAACAVAWLTAIWRRRKKLNSANIFLFLGVITCLAHGSFDMELHIPSTMIAFGLLSVWSFSELIVRRHSHGKSW